MPKFIAGLLLGIIIQQPTPHRLIAKIKMETQPAPTGTIRHWSFEGTGGVCSADIASPFGKAMDEVTHWDGATMRLITFEQFDLGIGR